MTQEEKYNLAKWAMQHALDSGADAASIVISESKSSTVDVREQKIDTLKEAIQSSLSVRLFVDQKYSAHRTNRLDKQELAHFIEQAIAGTKYLSPDPYRQLPDPALYYQGNGQELGTVDPSYDKVDPATKVKLAFDVEKEAFEKDERIISVSASYSDNTNSRLMVTSNGFEGETKNSSFSLSASVSVNGGDARPSEGWYERAIFFDQLKKSEIGSLALERALKKIGQEKIKSGKYDMLIENRAVSRLFYPLLSALDGYSIQQKNSFLIDQLGKKVASEKLSLVDDPLIPGGLGSKLFDGEGLAAKKRTVFDKGVLGTYFIDTYYARKLEMEPTTGDTSNLVFELGDKDLASMVKGMKKGILVTGFNGGNTNGSTGDFSYGIDGFLVENGEIIQPVSEMNISGNMKSLWMSLAELGNDPNPISSWQIPSMLFEGIDFSGS
ncbi:TldD/PmbA family protein [Sunxiuqinia elliptica]|uniref:PmbA protein n=1 Tax=Sunxiuqinia elliptica TaxID=655355 RepID=A0A1I2C8E8_9BACT|nr:TldD/PmbA family protein [Sunxiuqinia elliptica]SFE64465.1 PmbA protein [Sunxiuqinia elliptica]